jgi:hypothetical protein
LHFSTAPNKSCSNCLCEQAAQRDMRREEGKASKLGQNITLLEGKKDKVKLGGEKRLKVEKKLENELRTLEDKADRCEEQYESQAHQTEGSVGCWDF